MAKKSRDRSNTARPTSVGAGKPKNSGKDKQAVDQPEESRQSLHIRPQRKNLPMLILSIVLLVAWLIIILLIAVNK